ncbi:MAG: histidine kinase [Bacteroidetes bacterium]|nr:histidine kinase [Bacteroidota bacterium]
MSLLSACLIAFIFVTEVRAQFPYLNNYVVNDGLPSSRIYDIEQDSSGYIWFATENGISRYDGYAFRNFTKPQGLPSNSVIRLFLDYKDRLWYLTYQGEVGYIQNEKIYVHWISHIDSLTNIVFYDQIYVDTNESIYLTPFTGGLIKIIDDSLYISAVHERNTQPLFNYAFYYQKRKLGFILGFINLNVSDEDQFINDNPGFNLFQFENLSAEKASLYHKNIVQLESDSYLISLGRDLVLIKDSNVIWKRKFDQEIVKISLDREKNLWISTKFSGVYMYRNYDLDTEPLQFLKNYTVSEIYQDFEGSFWFSTTENGVFYVASVQFINYDRHYLGISDGVIQSLVSTNGDLFFSTSNRGVYKAKLYDTKLKLYPHFKVEGIVNSTVTDLLITSDGELWIPSSQYLRYDQWGHKIRFAISKNKHNGYSLIELFDGRILLGVSNGYYVYDKSGLIDHSWNYNFNIKSFAFTQSADSIVWIGSINGLYANKNGIIRPVEPASEVLSSRISDLISYQDFLVIGTFDNGMAIFQRKNNKITYINETEGLASHRVKTLFIDRNDRIWVGTNQGLSEISILDSDSLRFSIRNFTIWDGLPSNEINDIGQADNEIVLATDEGLVRFDPNELSLSRYLPQVIIESVSVNDSKKNFLDQNHDFNFDQNNIEFGFRLKSFKDPQKASYQYKLEGYEEEWFSTRNTSIRYPKLDPGAYRFVIKAKSMTGIWSDIQTYDFKIRKHITQLWAFRIPLIILVATLLFLITYVIISGFRKREDLKRQAILAEQKAVRAQMNPHFIFNSLNSIQNFIVDKDEKNANFYLVLFSSLIRKILEASKKNFIPLKEEIETIKLYLELEKFRFDKNFDFSIEIDSRINPDQISIPSLLLQPYLENAIWHGIVPKQSKGKLQVEFKLHQAGWMKISITDDGIGRKKAGEISKRRKHHQPTGMKNVEERLSLLNKLNKTNMQVNVIDLYNDHNEASGTRVEFLIEI